jgi:hypothetical protein
VPAGLPTHVLRMMWSVPAGTDNPAWGHCDVTALLLSDLLGGDLLVGEVYLDGVQHGFHWWNRLPSGIEIDLTREQFRSGHVVTAKRVVKRPAGRPARRYEEYKLLRPASAHTLAPCQVRPTTKTRWNRRQLVDPLIGRSYPIVGTTARRPDRLP